MENIMLIIWLLLSTLQVVHGTTTQVRLVGGSNSMEGTIQLNHNGWGTVCDDNFGTEEATVICRMLGYNGPSTSYDSAHFGAASGNILLDSLGCSGTETDISQCSSDGWGNNDCSHSEDAGVKCTTEQLELVGGQGNFEGTVNLNGGAICDSNFTDLDARVICRHLGFISGKAVNGSMYGELLLGSIEQDILGCLGSETLIGQCPAIKRSGQSRTCSSGMMAGVVCGHTPVRLVGGVLPSEGRLEVMHKGAWGTVCNQGFGQHDADVVCRMLGFNTSTISASVSGDLGAATGPVWLSGVNCAGTESDLDVCSHSGWDNTTCDHKQDIDIKCSPTEVRLTGGPGPWEGDLELRLEGRDWLYVCDESFDHNAAEVICAMMGYDVKNGQTVLYKSNAMFSHASSHHISGTYRCHGDEKDIRQCVFHRSSNCTRAIGIKCEGARVRLVDGASTSEGRVELYHEGKWGTVCDRNWDKQDADVICRMHAYAPLDSYVTGTALPGTYFGYGDGPVHVSNVGCSGNESDITSCQGDWTGGVNCDHSRDAGVICSSWIPKQLAGRNSSSQGTVLFYSGGKWNTYCNTGWNITDLKVICRELGFWNSQPRFISNAYTPSTPSYDAQPYCSGNEGSLEFCSFLTSHSCSAEERVSVDCNATNAGSQQMRLVDGPGPWKGRLELFSNGHWASFCANYWNQSLADMVCRNLYFTGTNTTWYPVARGYSPVNFRSLECDVGDSNIGHCRVNYNVSECLPSTETVGIDCSGGVSVSLGNSSSLSGEVMFHSPTSSTPLSVCQSSVTFNVAKTLCAMEGYTDTSPFVSGVPSNSSLMFSVLGCDGWETHVAQCLATNNTAINCTDKASVSCFNCSREYTTGSGSTASQNYPRTYPPYTDCLIMIKPPTNAPYKLQFHELDLAGDGDFVEVRDSAHGHQLGYFENDNAVPLLVSDKGFYIRFKTNSAGGARGFNVSWSELQVQDAIDLQCGVGGWNVAVNTTVLRHLFPETGVSQLKLGDQYCTGKVQGDLVIFSQSYTDCLTVSKTTGDNVVYSNSVIYPDSRTPFPLIVHGYKWKVEVECDVDRRDTFVNNFRPNQTVINQVPHVTSSGHYSSEVKFYSDGTFYTQIQGNPLTLKTGDDVFVSVAMNSDDIHVKMRVDTCYTKPNPLADPSLTYTLIQNGCVVDSFTHILSQGTHETRFVFNAFEFPASHDDVYIFCNATYCKTSDTSPICTQTCQQTGGAPIIGRSLSDIWTNVVNKYSIPTK